MGLGIGLGSGLGVGSGLEGRAIGFAVHRVARLAIALGAIGVLGRRVDSGEWGGAEPATFRVHLVRVGVRSGGGQRWC